MHETHGGYIALSEHRVNASNKGVDCPVGLTEKSRIVEVKCLRSVLKTCAFAFCKLYLKI